MNLDNAILEINSKLIIKNYQLIRKFTKSSYVGATIKADAYGLGADKIFKLLYKNGCNHFFVASLQEALSIRKKYFTSNLYVLNGLENNNLKIFYDNNIIPILVSEKEIDKYSKSKYNNLNYKIGIHIDTGINRLGIDLKDLKLSITKRINAYILISHLASAEEFNNSYNKKQNNKFKSIFNMFKSVKFKSLANSAGIINNTDFHYNILRPGISLYG